MASQNIIETIKIKGHIVEIYQDPGTKFRWRVYEGSQSIGSSEQGFKTLEQCKSNLNNLTVILSDTITNSKSSKQNIGTAKVEVMTDDDFDEINYSEEHKAMDWNIFWLMVIILLLSLFIFVRIFVFR